MKTIYLLIEDQYYYEEFEYRVIKAFTHKDKGEEIEEKLNSCIISSKAYVKGKRGVDYYEYRRNLEDIKEVLCKIEPDISDSVFIDLPYYNLKEVQLHD
jgi:hypothetical protein